MVELLAELKQKIMHTEGGNRGRLSGGSAKMLPTLVEMESGKTNLS